MPNYFSNQALTMKYRDLTWQNWIWSMVGGDTESHGYLYPTLSILRSFENQRDKTQHPRVSESDVTKLNLCLNPCEVTEDLYPTPSILLSGESNNYQHPRYSRSKVKSQCHRHGTPAILNLFGPLWFWPKLANSMNINMQRWCSIIMIIKQ